MKLPSTLLLLLGLGAGGVSGYSLSSAELQAGTYYIDIDRAVDAVPSFVAMRTERLGPIQARGQAWDRAQAKLEEDAASFALLDEGSAEYRAKKVELALREEALRSEYELLNEALGQVREGLAFEAQKMVQRAVETLGAEGGYEHISLQPIQYQDIPWSENPNMARDMLRSRSTLWIHPDRDLTDELIQVLTR